MILSAFPRTAFLIPAAIAALITVSGCEEEKSQKVKAEPVWNPSQSIEETLSETFKDKATDEKAEAHFNELREFYHEGLDALKARDLSRFLENRKAWERTLSQRKYSSRNGMAQGILSEEYKRVSEAMVFESREDFKQLLIDFGKAARDPGVEVNIPDFLTRLDDLKGRAEHLGPSYSDLVDFHRETLDSFSRFLENYAEYLTETKTGTAYDINRALNSVKNHRFGPELFSFEELLAMKAEEDFGLGDALPAISSLDELADFRAAFEKWKQSASTGAFELAEGMQEMLEGFEELRDLFGQKDWDTAATKLELLAKSPQRDVRPYFSQLGTQTAKLILMGKFEDWGDKTVNESAKGYEQALTLAQNAMQKSDYESALEILKFVSASRELFDPPTWWVSETRALEAYEKAINFKQVGDRSAELHYLRTATRDSEFHLLKRENIEERIIALKTEEPALFETGYKEDNSGEKRQVEAMRQELLNLQRELHLMKAQQK